MVTKDELQGATWIRLLRRSTDVRRVIIHSVTDVRGRIHRWVLKEDSTGVEKLDQKEQELSKANLILS